ncbi:MAG: hypothetical protein JWM36_4641 [Hyphomicrobiales bacterium]|nr:hypothetical protein [Hyphomicrobiales bacterium]
MLVYGDHMRRIDRAAWIERLRTIGQRTDDQHPTAAHERLVSLLIETGQIAQAVADDVFEAAGGRDVHCEASAGHMDLVADLARLVCECWTNELQPQGALLVPDALLRQGPGEVIAREQEGFSYYAVYPEAFYEAARRLRVGGTIQVVGLRSIGTTLAAMVAAGCRAHRTSTLRPHGHPYDRIVSAPDLIATLQAERPDHVCIVDEGPGRSGSSMASVVSAIEGLAGVNPSLHLFPSHTNMPGGEASPLSRRVFEELPRHVTSLDDLLITSGIAAHRLQTWVSDVTGPAIAPLLDVSAGGWRAYRGDTEPEWPACDPQQERRKFIHTTLRGTFLLKFTGIGQNGTEKARLAEELSQANLTPRHLGTRHGFSIAPWRDDMRSVAKTTRGGLLPFIAHYLAFRRCLRVGHDLDGAGAELLRDMAITNVGVALGSDAASRMQAVLFNFSELFRGSVRCCIDGRMHAHKWLTDGMGHYLKTDAVEHHAGHDLVGAQDIAWDIAGADSAFHLTRRDTEQLRLAVEDASGKPVSENLLESLTYVQPAFELGRLWLAVGANAGSPEEGRLQAALNDLTINLEQHLWAGYK